METIALNNEISRPTGWKRLLRFCLAGRTRQLATLVIVLLCGYSAYSLGQAAPPAFQAISLSSDPLYITTTGDKPTLALALSVEYPTVGAQYVWDGSTNTGSSVNDDAYRNTKEYLGYYDAEACYSYNNAPTETVASGQIATDYKRFDRSGAANARKCSNAFSGNFLNWASNSAIDMLRLALSGGDRYIDTSTLTILQRAVIPSGDPVCMWNSSNFPAKRLQAAGDGSTRYWGAVPTAMATAAAGGDIWVANQLDRIYFKSGTGPSGNCANTADYNLNGPTQQVGPVGAGFNLPNDAAACAGENAICVQPNSVNELWYGVTGKWRVAPVSGNVACTNANFGDPASGISKNCYLRPYSGIWRPTTTTGQLNADGFFFSRVSVCATDSSGTLLDVRDYGLCTRYPSGNYKPTGVVQKYSDQLRLAAFGYLLDQTASYNNGRYGGVLRAPMKFVGQKTFDIYGQNNTPASGNPKAEWNANTGVFTTNPDGDTSQATPISGVINYLNKFGRTGTKGRYKIYDPVGELHYETLRYLQGLPPSADAISNITPAMYDGFPVFTSWVDPYGDGRSNTSNYACLKSNIIVIGDINTHDGARTPTPNPAANIIDIGAWTTTVNNFERNTSSTYLDGQGASRTTANPNGANNRTPGTQMMGQAYWAHSHDIRGTGWTGNPALQRPGLRVKTFTFDVNEYGAQNDTGTRQYANQFFMAAKYGGYEADPANASGSSFNTFGNPFKRQDGTNDNSVWQKIASPGEADSYYLQSGARGVLSAFDEIFQSSGSAARSIAGSASQSRSTTTAGNTVYQASFQTADWSGDVVAQPVVLNSTTNQVGVSTINSWSASDQLLALPTPATSRNIVVGRTGGNASPTATAFTWAAIAGTSLVADLNKPDSASAADGNGANRLLYLRGDRSKEGTVFRARNKLLGDVVNSAVAYSGRPSISILSSSYSSFYTARQNRVPAVFVGANDGMLHAFNASASTDAGKELFAYIPSWMGPKLSALTGTTYLGAHQSYVDGSPTVAEAQVANTGAATDWRTVLVSGTGAGGKGVFGLDVTDPSTFSANNVMWEFTAADDSDMGYVVGRPQILKIRKNATNLSPAVYGWYAVVPSGVNNYVADGYGRFSSTGKPALFFLDISKPVGTAWVLGTNYFKVSLPADATLSQTRGPGLVNFSAALNDVGATTKIYAGDLHGNMWKLVFANAANGTADWSLAKLSAFNRGTTDASAFPLYTARDGSSVVQPISMAPSLVRGGSNGVTYVAFGTGKYLEQTDKTTSQVNSVYAVFDTDATVAADGSAGAEVSGRGRLQAANVTTSTGAITVPPFIWGRATSDTDTARRSGWYVDLPTSGERSISSALIFGDSLVFGSLIPGASGGANTCGAAGGSGYQYVVNADTGKGVLSLSRVGIQGQPILTAVPSATGYDNDNSGQQVKTTYTQVIQVGSLGTAAPDPPLAGKTVIGRLSWRQINNYQELKNAP